MITYKNIYMKNVCTMHNSKSYSLHHFNFNLRIFIFTCKKIKRQQRLIKTILSDKMIIL